MKTPKQLEGPPAQRDTMEHPLAPANLHYDLSAFMMRNLDGGDVRAIMLLLTDNRIATLDEARCVLDKVSAGEALQQLMRLIWGWNGALFGKAMALLKNDYNFVALRLLKEYTKKVKCAPDGVHSVERGSGE